MRGVRRVFRISLVRARDVDREVDDEIALNLSMWKAKLRATSVEGDDAARLARVRFGNGGDSRDECLAESQRGRQRDRRNRVA